MRKRIEDGLPEGAVIMEKIEIVQIMLGDDVTIVSLCQDNSGDELGLVTKLGMLEAAKSYLVHEE